jgi:hypothetical protein
LGRIDKHGDHEGARLTVPLDSRTAASCDLSGRSTHRVLVAVCNAVTDIDTHIVDVYVINFLGFRKSYTDCHAKYHVNDKFITVTNTVGITEFLCLLIHNPVLYRYNNTFGFL